MSTETFVRRRRALAEDRPGLTFVLPSAPVSVRNRTVQHPYRQDSDLLYLTGIDRPETCLVIRADGTSVLYAREPDARRAIWYGAEPSLTDLGAAAGVDDVRPATTLAADLLAHVRMGDALAYRLGRALDAEIVATLERASAGARTARTLLPIHDPHGPIGLLRARKDAGEIERMRASARLAATAHARLHAEARPGDTGLALAGRFEALAREGGAVRMAYDTIAARAEEATTLHATPTRVPLREGDLVLVDAGCELDDYASDITRTWPVSGETTPAQASILGGVVAAQRAAIAEVAPGKTLRDVHARACEILSETCARLGLAGDLDRWYPHMTSHWIGLDVHDAGPYEIDGEPVRLEEGMVFTVEPGLYVPIDSDAPEALRGIGVRIEDTMLVTSTGAEILSASPRG